MPAERARLEDEDTALRVCPHCEAQKCSLCDMGNDVSCGNCPYDDDA